MATTTLTSGHGVRRPRVHLWDRIYRVPTWWFELLLIVAFDIAYEHVRNLVKLQPVEAVNHGLAVLRVSAWFHLHLEHTFNQLLVNHHWLAEIADYDYTTLHLPLTATVLIWVFWKHRTRYLAIRNVLMLTTVLGLAGFWAFPTAPPRLLPGHQFIDTTALFRTWGSLADPKVASATNQFAAMPSMHCAWALWVGLSLFFLARNRIIRALGLLYPAWTVFVVLGTANHYLLDAVMGVTCVVVSTLVVAIVQGGQPWGLSAAATARLRRAAVAFARAEWLLGSGAPDETGATHYPEQWVGPLDAIRDYQAGQLRHANDEAVAVGA